MAEDLFDKVTVTYFDQIERQIQLAATKAALLVTADSLLLTVYVRITDRFQIFSSQAIPGEYKIIFSLAGALLIGALVAALLAIMPRLRPPRQESVFYYWSVAGMEETAYAAKLQQLQSNSNELTKELAFRIHGKARWLKQTFIRIKISIWLAITGAFACSLVFAVMIGKTGGIVQKPPIVDGSAQGTSQTSAPSPSVVVTCGNNSITREPLTVPIRDPIVIQQPAPACDCSCGACPPPAKPGVGKRSRCDR